MVKNRFLSFCIVVFASLLSTACVPTSINPLSHVDEAKVDTYLIGTWVPVSAKEKGYFHILPGKGGEMDGVAVSFNNKNGGEWSRFSLFSSQIDNHSFLNVRELEKTGKLPNGEKTPYFLVRYQITEKGRLQLWLLSQKAAKEAIGKGLRGEIRKSMFGSNIRITAATEELAEYLQQVGPTALFADPLAILQRQ